MILEELNKKIETSICGLYNEKIPSKFFFNFQGQRPILKVTIQ